MNQIERIIENINHQEDYPLQFDLLLGIILDEAGKNTSRPETIKLLQALDSIVSSNSELIHKFYSILIARDLFFKQYSQFLSLLGSSKLLQSMLFIAKNLDPMERMENKGKSLGQGDLGNDYITLILECIIKWSERYPLTAQQSPTRFRMSYQQLIRDKVVLPKQFRFFTNDIQTMNNEEKRSSQMNLTGSNLSENMSTKGLETSLKNSIAKIEGFLSFLDECSDADKLKMEIDKYHRLFQQQHQKKEFQLDKILNERLLDQESTHLFLGIQEFYRRQKMAYNTYLTNTDDLKSYIDTIAVSSEQIRQKIQKTVNKNKFPRTSNSSQISYNISGARYPSISYKNQDQKHNNDRRVTDVVNSNKFSQPVRNSYGRVEPAYKKNESSEEQMITSKNNYRQTEPNPPNNQSYINRINGSQYANNYRSMGNEVQPNFGTNASSLNRQTQDTVRTSGYFNDRQLTNEAERGNMLIKQLMSRITTSTKGFGKIKKQLDEERSLSNRSRNPNRSRRSKSPRPVSRHRRFQEESNFTGSRDISKAETMQISPGAKVTKNDYSGSLINPFSYDLSDMSFDQGWRKYRKANLKPKGILFENQHIQIGYKSQAVYEDLQTFQVFIRIGIFIGNKVPDPISKVSVQYEGDESALMYLTPKDIGNSISQNQQIKQDLVIIPLSFPFNLISCVLKYSVKRQSHTVVFYLPNSILKLATIKQIETYQFKQHYQQGLKNEFRTHPFKLSKDWPPSGLNKLLQNSIPLTDYHQFASQKSYSEYILGLHYQLLESEDYLCKIIVRPDMTAVIQLVSLDESKDSILYGTTLLQTLQLMLQSQNQSQ